MDNDEKLRGLLNAHGYLLQAKVRAEIERSAGDHGWEVELWEHPWTESRTGSVFFIDLVLTNGPLRAVVECKRLKDGEWLFLRAGSAARSEATLAWSHRNSSGKNLVGYQEFQVQPPTFEAEFCLVRGQGEKDKPMLERTAGALLASLEALAAEELTIIEARHVGVGWERAYLPVIVTSAKLFECKVDPETIDLATGTVTRASFGCVPYIRFTKTLGRAPTGAPIDELSELNSLARRTVFIVQAERISEFLGRLRLDPPVRASYPLFDVSGIMERWRSKGEGT